MLLTAQNEMNGLKNKSNILFGHFSFHHIHMFALSDHFGAERNINRMITISKLITYKSYLGPDKKHKFDYINRRIILSVITLSSIILTI